MKFITKVVALLFVTSALADPQPHGSDTILSKTELESYLSDSELAFFDEGRASYWADGRYAYRYAPGERAHVGTYKVTGPSEVCVTYPNGAHRCDLIVKSGARVVLITKRNERFPIKHHDPLDPNPSWLTAQAQGAL